MAGCSRTQITCHVSAALSDRIADSSEIESVTRNSTMKKSIIKQNMTTMHEESLKVLNLALGEI